MKERTNLFFHISEYRQSVEQLKKDIWYYLQVLNVCSQEATNKGD